MSNTPLYPGSVSALKHCAEIVNQVRNLAAAEIEKLQELQQRDDFPEAAYHTHLHELKRFSDWTSDIAQAALLTKSVPKKRPSAKRS